MNDYRTVNKNGLFYGPVYLDGLRITGASNKQEISKERIKNKIIFADWTASSVPCKFVDERINKIIPYYSNTHSNAYCGILMKNLIVKTKKLIRTKYNLTDEHKIIFTGSGTTGAINHLIFCMNLLAMKTKINIFLSMLEHHSNYLPWINLVTKNREMGNSNINIIFIPTINEFYFDEEWLFKELKNNSDTLNIISITACSNVIGIKYDIENIYSNIQTTKKNNILLVDYACSAPYIKTLSHCDAIFMSPHKFLGGYSTPGLLIAKKSLFHNNLPFCPGGGCIQSVDHGNVIYAGDIEKRESGGTPNIIGIIKIYYVFKLHDICIDLIEHNEKIITKYVFDTMTTFKNKYNNFICIAPEIVVNRLPIVCIAIKGFHYNLIVIILSDLFGIQTRGGVSCTSMLADKIKKLYNIEGWCRITFNWSMNWEEVTFILNAIEDVINNIDTYSKNYVHNAETNLFTFRDN